MVETLSGMLNAISGGGGGGGGGNVYNVMFHVYGCHSQRANIFYCVSNIISFQKIIVYKIPLGGGGL